MSALATTRADMNRHAPNLPQILPYTVHVGKISDGPGEKTGLGEQKNETI